MSAIVNVSAYRFAELSNLKPLRERLLQTCRAENLKGTILLSTEGINLFVAGGADAVDRLLQMVRSVPGLEDLPAKFSTSQAQPFRRMLVKIKQEIITFGVAGVDPVRQPAPRISPRELKQWLDEGRPVTLLDTRNDFEVQLGTFDRATPIGIRHFRDFPAAADQLPRSTDRPIVTFCTGGIRCEKAAPYLLQRGFRNVWQLDGGILKYFEECGQEHFHGECFVFDQRVGVSADLDESGHGLCFVCQSLLTPEELNDPLTVEGVSCPRCYQSPAEQQVQALERHREKLTQVTTPLPGRQPRDNFRPLKIHARHDGWTILDFIGDVFRHMSLSEWQRRFAAGEIVDHEHRPVPSSQVVHPGERYFTCERQQVEPDVNAAIDILYEDAAMIVVNKPAPLPMHPSGRYHRNTLEWILRRVYVPQKPRPAHRLDANTSGVVVLTRTAAFAKVLQQQFERGDVEKRYLARVIGHPPSDVFQCDSPITHVAGPCGSRSVAEMNGVPAQTEFAVLTRHSDGTALLSVTPRTGRTNQIRIHLWHLGWPIVGDRTYSTANEIGEMQTLGVSDPPLCLFSWQLSFQHPQTRQRVTFTAPQPAWAQ